MLALVLALVLVLVLVLVIDGYSRMAEQRAVFTKRLILPRPCEVLTEN